VGVEWPTNKKERGGGGGGVLENEALKRIFFCALVKNVEIT